MCPACLMNIAIVAGGATSAGGLAAVFLKSFHFNKIKRSNQNVTNEGENDESQDRNA